MQSGVSSPNGHDVSSPAEASSPVQGVVSSEGGDEGKGGAGGEA